MEQKNNKTLKLVFVIFIALLCAGGLAAYYTISNSGSQTTDDAYVGGRVHTIASKVPGTVFTVPVVDNQNVKKGEMLVEIDSADYELKVNDAQAALEAEKATELRERLKSS